MFSLKEVAQLHSLTTHFIRVLVFVMIKYYNLLGDHTIVPFKSTIIK